MPTSKRAGYTPKEIKLTTSLSKRDKARTAKGAPGRKISGTKVTSSGSGASPLGKAQSLSGTSRTSVPRDPGGMAHVKVKGERNRNNPRTAPKPRTGSNTNTVGRKSIEMKK